MFEESLEIAREETQKKGVLAVSLILFFDQRNDDIPMPELEVSGHFR